MVTYPNGRKVHSTYGSGSSVADVLDRVDMLEEDSGGSPGTDLVLYSYNGTSRHVVTDYPQPDFRLDQYLFWMYTGVYWALDRFGRPVDHMWDGYNSTFDVARVQYGYDYAGNRTWREDVKASDNGYHYDQFYTYDGLHRLKTFDMGNLTGGPPPTGIAGTPANEEDSTLDQLGNWTGYVVKASGSTTLNQTRYHNSVNEIDTDDNHANSAGASITATTGTNWYDPLYDAAGNMLVMPQPASPTSLFIHKYDAWNRPVEVKNTFSTVLVTYEYDGLGRRIVRTVNSGTFAGTYDYYYNEDWQLLEERKGGSSYPLAQYVWHPYYIDALALRYYDADMDNILNENNDGAHRLCAGCQLQRDGNRECVRIGSRTVPVFAIWNSDRARSEFCNRFR